MTNYSNSFVANIADLFNNEGTMFFYDNKNDKVQKLIGFDLSTEKFQVEDAEDIKANSVQLDALFKTAEDALDFRAFVLNGSIKKALKEDYPCNNFNSIVISFKIDLSDRWISLYRNEYEDSKIEKDSASN